jgi:guanidinoacetate N-methyltransferase
VAQWGLEKALDEVARHHNIDLSNWTTRSRVLTRAAIERSEELESLKRRLTAMPDRRLETFTCAIEQRPDRLDGEALAIGGQPVMQAWETPLMRALVCSLPIEGGDVIEIGFGLGIANSLIVAREPRSYTVLERNPYVAEKARASLASLPFPSWVIETCWRETDFSAEFDAILFDAYPSDSDEMMAMFKSGRLLFEDNLPSATKALKKGGVMTFYCAEVDSLSRTLQRRLIRDFDSFSIRVVEVQPDKSCSYWCEASMVAVHVHR